MRSRQKSSPCLKLYKFNFTTNDIGRWSPMESGNFFYAVYFTSLSISLFLSLSFFLSQLPVEKHQTFRHLSPLSTNFPFGCPVWSALPAWLFAFASQNACVYYDFFFFLDRFHACRPIGFSPLDSLND